MAQRNPVVWFEIPAADLDRATRFYERVLGVTMQRFEMGPLLMSWFPMAEGAPGAAGTLIHNEAYTPSHEGTLIYISVDDIDAALGRVAEAGGKVLQQKQEIGEFGFMGLFEDSEGNRVALHADE